MKNKIICVLIGFSTLFCVSTCFMIVSNISYMHKQAEYEARVNSYMEQMDSLSVSLSEASEEIKNLRSVNESLENSLSTMNTSSTENVYESETEVETEWIYDPYSDPDFVEPESLSPEALANTHVVYNIDMNAPFAAFIPVIINEWRVRNHIESGEINVFDFEEKEDTLIISLEYNGYPYIFEEEKPSVYGN